jgi:hypothetical protein
MMALRRIPISLCGLIAAGLLVFTSPVAAGPDANADHLDAAIAWARVKDSIDRRELETFVGRFGDTLYGELARERRAQIQPDANQPVVGSPSERKEKSSNSFLAGADSACRVAASCYWGRDDQSVRLWSLPSGQPLATISLPFAVKSFAVAQDKVAIQGPDSIRLYNVNDGLFLRAIDKSGPMGMLFFSTDRKLLLSVPPLPALFRTGGRLFNVETGVEYPQQVMWRVSAAVMYQVLVRQKSAASDCPVEKQQIFADLQ